MGALNLPIEIFPICVDKTFIEVQISGKHPNQLFYYSQTLTLKVNQYFKTLGEKK